MSTRQLLRRARDAFERDGRIPSDIAVMLMEFGYDVPGLERWWAQGGDDD